MFINTLNAIKSITVSSLTKMLFWKHLIRTFECYFERDTFDWNINSGKLVQKLSSEQIFYNIKLESNSIFLKCNKNEKTVFLF